MNKTLNILDQGSVRIDSYMVLEFLVEQGLEVKCFPSGHLSRFVKLTENNKRVLEATGYTLERRLDI